MNFPEHTAWTGGSSPKPYAETSTVEQIYTVKLFMADCRLWLDYWREERVPLDVKDIFWNRARGDAHATFRAAAREQARAI